MKPTRLSAFFKKRGTRKTWDNDQLKLNLGCGHLYMPGWVNVDLDPSVKSDLVCGFLELHDHFNKDSVAEVLMLHSISYLRLWEARIFLKRIFDLLKQDGKLIMEFPDLVKCAEVVRTSENKTDQYLEGVRGIYAFDLDQIRKKDLFVPYAFGWSGWHMKQELMSIGFKEVNILDPETHGNRVWRDTRIVAVKSR